MKLWHLPFKLVWYPIRTAYRLLTPEKLPRSADIRNLARQVREAKTILVDERFTDDILDKVMALLEAPASARDAIRAFIKAFLEETYQRPPEPPYGDLMMEAKWADQAHLFLSAVNNPETLYKIGDCFFDVLARFLRDMPKGEGMSFGTVPAKDYATPELVQDMILEIARVEPLLPALRAQLNQNATNREFITPIDDKAFTLEKYLKNTPLLPLFDIQLPMTVPLKTWGEHAFMAAPSGHGKTMSIKAIVKGFRDLPDPPAVFAIDCMGSLFKGITEHYDDVVVLDPETAQMNLFKLNVPPALYFYIFRAIDQKLTPRQATMLLMLIKLLGKAPGATLTTLHDVCAGIEPLEPYYKHLLQLTEMEQKFFLHQFNPKDRKDRFVTDTKAQIASRLMTLSMSGNLFKLFSAPENTFRPRELMDQGKLVAVNATGESGIVFGRFVIASIMAAARSRANIPEHKRKLAMLVVDECKDYMDETTTEILTQARQFGLGMFQATQFLADIPGTIKAATLGNTAVRFSGPVELADPLILSKALRCEVPFIMNMTKVDNKHSEWACYVRNQTKTAVKLTVPMGVMEKMASVRATARAERTEAKGDNATRIQSSASKEAETPQASKVSSPKPTTPKKENKRRGAADLDTEY